MSEPSPFDRNQELAAMKQSIADRAFNIKIKGYLISGALAVGAIALMFFMPGLLGAATPLLGLVMAAGSTIAGLFTMKEAKKLEIDEQFVNSYMQGKNYWGEGYRKEVAEYGFGGPRIHTHGPEMGGIPAQGQGQQRGTSV